MGGLQNLLAASAATANVTVERDETGDIIVSGTVPDRTTEEMVLANVKALGGSSLLAEGKVIDRLLTATTSQVDVKVYILEIDDTGLKNLGIDLQAATYQQTAPGTQPAFTRWAPPFFRSWKPPERSAKPTRAAPFFAPQRSRRRWI